MKAIQITDKGQLNNFISSKNHSQFLQSWEWGEFQAAAGGKTIRIGFDEEDRPIFVLSLIKKRLPLGRSYLYAPRIDFSGLNEGQLNFIFKEIGQIAHREKAVFLRFEPLDKLRMPNAECRIIKTIDVQPSRTIILDVGCSEEKLLAGMHPKTRYNIRLAGKKGVTIRAAGAAEFEQWWQIMEETRERDRFRLHSREYYRKMLDIGFINLPVALFQGRLIAGNIISFFGDTATYIHGASSNSTREVMAPYALQWFAIREAKERGLKYYDLNGADAAKWPGVTRFKQGFGGREQEYPGTFDLVFDSTGYTIYKLARRVRRSM